MRRVDRGSWPLDDANNPKSFQPYNKAKADLLSRLGGYCSYCERTGDLHIEHVVPTNHRPDLEQEWTNFLFGCANCNAIKGDRNLSRNGYLWPDQVKKIGTTRSAFAREALYVALRRTKIKEKEQEHREGYARNPVQSGEFSQWGDDTSDDPNLRLSWQ